ncbi:E3 ubiquitin-protein ligase MARCHF3 [Brienomyrus brachyistius]|uniref:E3 ubiquitin-protein ligase MARCHF3 n=1 Tax=Brienomyrus brachyistius TaxID=42636 RepID=UPI0020B2DCB8|nr:E3 ubiquitin-protein ligase MARCHF3 [Brienomyrus brachyistius]
MAPFLAAMVSHEATSSALGSPVTLQVKATPEHGSGNESQPEVVIDNSAPPLAVSSGSSEELFCRICHEGRGAEQLLSPCECSGSLASVHRSCLERWLTASSTGRCELCRFEFALERQPRPLTEWLHAPSMRYQRRTLCGDALCFTFITPLASLSGWLCVRGAVDLYHSNSMEAAGLLVLTVALLAIYLFWTTVSLRYHVHLFEMWRQTNQRVRLQIPRPEGLPCGRLEPLPCPPSKDPSKKTVV